MYKLICCVFVLWAWGINEFSELNESKEFSEFNESNEFKKFFCRFPLNSLNSLYSLYSLNSLSPPYHRLITALSSPRRPCNSLILNELNLKIPPPINFGEGILSHKSLLRCKYRQIILIINNYKLLRSLNSHWKTLQKKSVTMEVVSYTSWKLSSEGGLSLPLFKRGI